MISDGQRLRDQDIKVLLVGNYLNDNQESMRRFADVLDLQLTERGVRVERLLPPTVFGRFHRGGRGVGKWLGYVDKFVLFPSRLRKRVRGVGVGAIVHICDHSNAVYVRYLGDKAHLVTCHDLLAVRSALGEFSGHRTKATGRFYQKQILHGLNSAGSVACVSDATRRDLLRLSTLDADAVSVVQNGLNYPYAPMPGALLRERLSRFDTGEKLKAGFILHIGGNQWYKNRVGVIQIYAQLCRKTAQPPCLLMVGKSFTTAMRRCVAANHLEDRVIELNAVSNEDLRTIYCAAQLLLFPSLAEGFGWPIVEAQACGCRVVTTNQPPMNDIGGDAAVYINLESPASTGDAVLSAVVLNDAAEAVLQLLRESSEAKRSRIERGLRNAAKFSTAKMVDDYVGLYQKALALPVEADRHAPALSLVN